MDSNILATPTVLRSAFVAPTLGGSVAGVCPKTGYSPVDVHVQDNAPATFRDRAKTWAAAGATAEMATGFRSSWSPLIT
jgi:hypothetical protein